MNFRSVRAAALAGAAAFATSSTAPAATADANTEVVVVTGSLITGAAEQAALPVTVLGADDLKKRGSPSMVDLIKQLPSSGAVFGDANQFTAGRTEGVSSVNLRNLSASRTLVLFNGRRIVTSAASALTPLVDLNMFPAAAIGRIEVLKDGAAATYGSEAIGGVVNIITRENFEGLELSADYRQINGSDGDYNAGAAWGWGDDNANVFLAAGYNKQSVLPATARNFATPKYTTQAGALAALFKNPGGGWSGAASPGTYINATTGAPLRDPACASDWAGEADTNIANPAIFPAGTQGSGGAAGRCFWRFADFDDLEEDNDRYQGYGEFNVKFGGGLRLHVEGLYGRTDVHNVPQSVSYLPNQFPGIGGPSKTIGFNALTESSPLFPNANYYIPVQNPGLAALRTLNPSLAAATANGLYAGFLIWRPLGIGGNSFFGGKGQLGQRTQDTYRLSASLEGDLHWLGDTHWQIAATQSGATADQITPDMLVDRLQLALRGFGSRLGSTDCNPATGTPGVGNCFYLNPFSTGVAKQAITGAVNPQFAAAVALDPRVVNDPNLIGWIYGPGSQETHARNAELVLDGLLTGTFGSMKLWSADAIGWALGAQYRRDSYEGRYSAYTDNTITPCVDTILTGTTTCTVRNGPYGFYGNYAPYHLTGETKAVFAEINLPITEDLQGNIAARYEKIYGGKDTFNPKGSLRWQATDWLALRASGGSTFRAPTLGALVPNPVTILAFSPAGGAYLAFDTFGNGGFPAGTVGLSPEKAKNFNVGAIVTLDAFSATVDFWHFDFANPLGTESGNAILGAIFPNAPASFVTGNQCANPAYAALINRVTFNSAAATQVLRCQATTSVSNIARVHVNTINGGSQMTQGIDFSAQYIWADAIESGDAFTFQTLGTYNLNYKVSQQVVEGVTLIPAFEAAGELNVGNGAVVSLPRFKGSIFAQYNTGPHNLRLTMNYVGSMADSNSPIASRRSIFTVPQAGFSCIPAAPVTPACLSRSGATVAPWITFDLAYQYDWAEQNLLFSLTMNNVFDKDPPFARTDYSYDAFTANPLGRTIKFGITAKVN
ncbi:MAG: TonB-dependent receptor [Alphaproteobacteria bacterium]|nr:TonB-dependent receptor [Alphaproteobacteria bacterium]MBL6938711.1 TonB-dependent receptor [Alphaproteobacteria bacterium]MBL7097932.1 TonB-dependent receptor [Alphaproteobacteria bacterium]